jgi:hypothetical protein
MDPTGSIRVSHRYAFAMIITLKWKVLESWVMSWIEEKFVLKLVRAHKSVSLKIYTDFFTEFCKSRYWFSRKHFYELRQVSKQISLQFKTSLGSPQPSISELRSKQIQQTCHRRRGYLWYKGTVLYRFTNPLILI